MKKFYVPHKRTAIVEKRIQILKDEYENRLQYGIQQKIDEVNNDELFFQKPIRAGICK